jgi:hypothetical protein
MFRGTIIAIRKQNDACVDEYIPENCRLTQMIPRINRLLSANGCCYVFFRFVSLIRDQEIDLVSLYAGPLIIVRTFVARNETTGSLPTSEPACDDCAS